MKQQLVAAGFVFLSILVPLKALATNFTKFFIFGDSLSDTGNVFQVTGGLFMPQNGIPKNPPYASGRFSNDKIWVEYVGNNLGLTPTLFTSLKNTNAQQGINFAFGGANSGSGNTVVKTPLPGVGEQVELYARSLQMLQEKADPNALYVVWGGANDYIFSGEINPSKPVENISRAVNILIQSGAKNIMVLNLPDLGKLPLSSAKGNSEQLTALTMQHNALLSYALNNFYNTNIIKVDIYAAFNQVLKYPEQFGLKDVITPCIVGSVANVESVCSSPNDLLFFDSIHPSTKGHYAIALAAQAALNGKTVTQSQSTSIQEASVIFAFFATLGTLAVGIGSQRRKTQV
ncbi:SGNH/GDSL hydrolase family protein [Calothrix sp. PCC 6303]|uniref:SGNH/GDSL hydrolase family protein n=1 Tax=Calothrix sp. PCC 6303 TaxID=1170562 RepID=UPI0002A0196D|nr:SGNH/GDSL hydrolase family protein [Calothrix sp. PCC 6303]AFZ02143.1 lipolytic protein G-D-S-L family [Calothrix sp. PCC 6303]